MSGIAAGSIIHVGGRTVINRLQDAGLQDPKVPTVTVYETGNDLVVGKVLTEADFRFQLTSWDVSTDLMALLEGHYSALGSEIAGGDPDGTIYHWENSEFINVCSPWKTDTGTAGGHIGAGVIIPGMMATGLTYRLGVTESAQMQVTLSTGAYYMATAYPVEEIAVGDGAAVAFVTSEAARVYRIGGHGSTRYQHVFGVLVNGVVQIPDVDYVESGGADPDVASTVATITFAVAPPAAAVVKFCYFSEVAHAIPQVDNIDTTTLPAAVRGRDITILIGDPGGSPLKLQGIQTFELQATRNGKLQREMGLYDPIGFAETGIDTNGTLTLEPRDIPMLFQFLSQAMGVDEDEVYGYINQYTFPMTAVIHDPKNPANIIKSIYVADAMFQAPGENVKVNTVTQFPVRWESQTGTFSEVKGQLPA